MTTPARKLITARTQYQTDGETSCGLTQAELAQRADIAYQTICRIETGKEPRPSDLTMAHLAKALEVSVEDLTGDEAATT